MLMNFDHLLKTRDVTLTYLYILKRKSITLYHYYLKAFLKPIYKGCFIFL